MISRISICVVVSLIIFLSVVAPASGQYDMVRRATAETADGIAFTVTVDQQLVVSGKDIKLYYSVKNNSPKAIYLVHENPPEFDTEGDSILVEAPIPIPVGHGEYNYSFTKINRGKEYKGQISIPSKVYVTIDIWPIEVAFGYVSDITGLNRQLRKDEDPAKLRGPLASRIKIVSVGKISVKITQ